MARTLSFILLLLCCHLQPAIAQNINTLVLYTKAASPYQKAYEQIIDGISSSLNSDLLTLGIPKDFDIKKIQQWIDENVKSADNLVILGSRALKASELLNLKKLQIITGALDILPGEDQNPGISIRVHPAVYLEHLRLLSPNSTKLIMFYNSNDKALVPIVENEAKNIGVTVNSIPVIDATSAIRNIASTFESVDPSDTAIWFTRDVIELNSEVLYPFILEESWNLHIPIFSEMISHTKRGFLFSLYPDYNGIGKELALIINDYAKGQTALRVRFSKAVKFAVNIRTLQHLGIAPDQRALQNIDLKFPAWKITN
jgi:putative ABC transport system substrate-binding protein